MLLAIDLGNTNIKCAIFDGKEITATFRLTTDKLRTSDEFGISIRSLLEFDGIKISDIDSAVIASVVPNVMHSLNNAVKKFFNIEPLIVGPGTKTGIKLVKTNPNEVGSDRIVDGVAALEMYGGPVIVVDYGTATKFDYFSADHVFESAVTCPGIMLSAQSLWSGTAKPADRDHRSGLHYVQRYDHKPSGRHPLRPYRRSGIHHPQTESRIQRRKHQSRSDRRSCKHDLFQNRRDRVPGPEPHDARLKDHL